ncbi:MAG TPA: hypothetical protein VHZ55_19650, partial [Bryobacteraceae bacterium]|nr:hypothetical protein [Bryobacteraceae bacterium]
RKSSSPPTSSATCSFWYAYPGTARGHLQDVQEVFGSRWLFVVDKPGLRKLTLCQIHRGSPKGFGMACSFRITPE